MGGACLTFMDFLLTKRMNSSMSNTDLDYSVLSSQSILRVFGRADATKDVIMAEASKCPVRFRPATVL